MSDFIKMTSIHIQWYGRLDQTKAESQVVIKDHVTSLAKQYGKLCSINSNFFCTSTIFISSTFSLLRPKRYFDLNLTSTSLLRPKLYFDLCISTNNSRFNKRSKYRGRIKRVEVQKRSQI